MASIAGASASLIVSAPLDVIKTRIQNRNFENPESGFKIVGSMMKNEGITSFFKGLVPKVSVQFSRDSSESESNADFGPPALDDRTKTGLLLLARADVNPRFRQSSEMIPAEDIEGDVLPSRLGVVICWGVSKC